MKVVGFDPFMSVSNALKLNPHIKLLKSGEEVMTNCDYLTIHVPLTPDTKDMVDADMIAKMKDGVRILNYSRDGLVNTDAVLEGLKSGKVAKYVTDFGNDKILGEEGVIVIPHLGASTAESEDNCAVMAAQELTEFISTGNIRNSVNYPAVSIPHTGAARICLAHLNIANMLSQITGIVSGAGINIENLSNGSKGNYAYTIVEIGVTVPDEIIPKLNAIEGMIKVRVIN
jgi:D-3-phosphoglycerate dehydrogenase